MEDSTPSSKRASPERAPKRTVLCAMQIPIAPEYRGQGLSTRMIRRMTEIGRDHGLDTLIAPVRPTRKHLYPLAPLERYISWRRPDRTHLDPWLRTHERLGAEIVKVAPQSTSIPASAAEWEEWAQMTFPETGAMGSGAFPRGPNQGWKPPRRAVLLCRRRACLRQ